MDPVFYLTLLYLTKTMSGKELLNAMLKLFFRLGWFRRFLSFFRLFLFFHFLRRIFPSHDFDDIVLIVGSARFSLLFSLEVIVLLYKRIIEKEVRPAFVKVNDIGCDRSIAINISSSSGKKQNFKIFC